MGRRADGQRLCTGVDLRPWAPEPPLSCVAGYQAGAPRWTPLGSVPLPNPEAAKRRGEPEAETKVRGAGRLESQSAVS